MNHLFDLFLNDILPWCMSWCRAHPVLAWIIGYPLGEGLIVLWGSYIWEHRNDPVEWRVEWRAKKPPSPPPEPPKEP